ncbi:MAG: hypothetical protein IJE68_03700 [Clostridia bacterium]|nr:hypothetical protein [Clostridia bacterium]
MKNKVIIDERMRQIEKQKLKELSYDLIEIKKSENVYPEISSHVDIFTCKIEDVLIVEPSQYEQIKLHLPSEYKVKSGLETISSRYPQDIKYNVCIIGKKAIHSFQHTDLQIKEELTKQEYEFINTTQGYTNCSIAVIDENSAIVTDKGLYKILQKHNLDVLYLDYDPDIKLLNDNQYSHKKGFIGGAISRIGNRIMVFGDLNKIDQDNKIRNFITNKNINIIEFKNLDVIDYGGIVEL